MTSAGNDGCNVMDFPIKRMPEAFVVGATSQDRFSNNQDARAIFNTTQSSRTGSNVAGFAPGKLVPALNYNGNPVSVSGTSLSSPYVAGLFASGCEFQSNLCQIATNPDVLYQALKNSAMTGSVVQPDGSYFSDGTPSRFFIRNAW